MTHRVSIIFPNYNGGKEPLDCLLSIQKLNYPEEKLQIIIIDNGSTDGSDLKIKERFPWVKLIKNQKNIGFAPAINQGIKLATGELVFITNDDIVFEKNSLKNSVGYLVNHKDVGIIGGKIYYKDKPNKVCSSGFVMNKWTGDVHPATNPNKLKEPDWVQGCAILISRKLLNRVGNLDPNYFLSFDDYDLCQRVRNAGYKVIYYPNAIFWHGESKTVDRNKPFKYYHWYKSKIYFTIKHLPLTNIISILAIQLFLITPFRALILSDGRLIPFLKALVWNIKLLKFTLSARKA